jgi:hypothetical protein
MDIICRGCGEKRSGVKSHIIPESFFRVVRGNEHTLKMISNTPSEFTKKAPIGVYDKTILCNECEKVFAKYDDYAAQVLLDRKALEVIKAGESIVGYSMTGIDYKLLKLFFISILWRASVSTMPFYRKVQLGSLENKAKELIWNYDASTPDTFSFVLARFSGDDSLNKVIMDPHPERWFGTFYYRFYLAGFILYIKASSNITPFKFRHFISTTDRIEIVSRGSLTEAKEFQVLKTGNFSL